MTEKPDRQFPSSNSVDISTHPKRKLVRWREEDREHVRDLLHQDKYSVSTISILTGIPQITVYRWRTRWKLSSNARRRKNTSEQINSDPDSTASAIIGTQQEMMCESKSEDYPKENEQKTEGEHRWSPHQTEIVPVPLMLPILTESTLLRNQQDNSAIRSGVTQDSEKSAKRGRAGKLTQEQINSILELIHQRVNDREISKQKGIPAHRVYYLRTKKGLPANDRRGRRSTKKSRIFPIVCPAVSRLQKIEPQLSSRQTNKIHRNWAPNHPKFSVQDEQSYVERYLLGDSNKELAEYVLEKSEVEISPKQAGVWAVRETAKMFPLLEVHRNLVKHGYVFNHSGKISFDITYPEYNSLGSDDSVDPQVLAVCDGEYPLLPYMVAIYRGAPSDSQVLDVLRQFSEFNRDYGKRVDQITLDDAPQFRRILPQIQEMFPGAKIQLSIFHAERHVQKVLAIRTVKGRVRILRENVLKMIHLIFYTNHDEITYWVGKYRKMNEDFHDKAVNQALNFIEENAELLTTFQKTETKVKSTSLVEGLFSALDDWIGPKRCIKSMESLTHGCNGFFSYLLFKKYETGLHKGKRPVDLCYRPEPNGIWRDFCF